MGWGYRNMIEHMPGKRKTLCSIPHMIKKANNINYREECKSIGILTHCWRKLKWQGT
jgi:hypothetical protein